MPTPPLSPMHASPPSSRLGALAAGALLAAGLAACSIPLPDRGTSSPSPGALSAAVLPPPAVSNAGDALVVEADRGVPLKQALTFRGVIPCADCGGQRLTLTLFPDWTYRLRRVYFGTRDGKDATFVELGKWERQPDSFDRIRLTADRNEGSLYEFISGSTLRLLGQNGEPIQSSLNYELTQQFEVDPIADRFPMRGRVLVADGKTTLHVCSTAKTYPVSSDGQGAELAARYTRLRLAPGTPTLMWIEGRVTGDAPDESIVVDAITNGTLDGPCDD